MSSTIQFGFDIDTGESVDNLDKLTGRMDGFISKYVKAMDELGRGSKTIVNLTKALGGNVGQLSLAANEIAKIKTALSGDMSIRGLSRNITTQFKGMTAELKTMFGEIPKELSAAMSHIPAEFKTISTQLTNILYQTENNLSKVAIAVQDIRDGFVDATKASESLNNTTKNTSKKTGGSGSSGDTRTRQQKETTNVEDYMTSLGLSVTGLTDVQKNLATIATLFSQMDLRKSILPDLKDSLTVIEAIKADAARISASLEKKVASNIADSITEEMNAKKIADRERITGIKRLSSTEMSSRMDSIRDDYTMAIGRDSFGLASKDETLKDIEAVKRAIDSLLDQTKLYGAEGAKELSFLRRDTSEYIKTLKEQIKLEEDAAKQKKTKDRKDAFDTEARVQTQTEADTLTYIKKLRSNIDDITKQVNDIQSIKKILDPTDLKDLSIKILDVKKDTASLSKANVDMTGEAGRAYKELMTDLAQVTAEMSKLKLSDKDNTFDYYGKDLPQIDDIRANIEWVLRATDGNKKNAMSMDELTQNYKELTIAKRQANLVGATDDAKVAGERLTELKEEIKVRQDAKKIADQQAAALQKQQEEQRKQQEAAQKQTDLQDAANIAVQKAIDLGEKYDDAQRKLAQATAAVANGQSVTDASGYLDSQYQSILSNVTEHNKLQMEVTETIKVLKDLASQADSNNMGGLKDTIEAYIEELKIAQDETKQLMKGQDSSGVGAISNTDILKTKEEVDITNQLLELIDRTRKAKEKLNNSKGKPEDTKQARDELMAVESAYEDIRKQIRTLTNNYSTLGVSGSQALENIKSQAGDLKDAMSDLNKDTSKADNKFKDFWDTMVGKMGKASIVMHFLTTTVGGPLGSMISGVFDFAKSFAEAGSELVNFEKQMKALYVNNDAIANREIARLKQLADYYGIAYSEISKYYVTITQQMKDMGAAQEFSNVFRENIIAAVRGQGLDSEGVESVFRAVQQMLAKNKPAMEEITTQLSERLPTFYLEMSKYLAGVEKNGERVYKKFERVKDSVDLKEMVSKNKVAWDDFIKGVAAAMGAIGQKAEVIRGSYEANIARLSNAWTSLQKDLMEGPAGEYLSVALNDITNMVKDPSFRSALKDMVAQVSRTAQIFLSIGTKILPGIVNWIENNPLFKAMGIDLASGIANSNQDFRKSYLAAQRSTFKYGSSPEGKDELLTLIKMLDPKNTENSTDDFIKQFRSVTNEFTDAVGGIVVAAKDAAINPTIFSRNMASNSGLTQEQWNASYGSSFDKNISAYIKEDIIGLYKSGYLQIDNEGDFKKATNTADAAANAVEGNTEDITKLTTALAKWEKINGDNTSRLINFLREVQGMQENDAGDPYYIQKAMYDAKMLEITNGAVQSDLNNQLGGFGSLLHSVAALAAPKAGPLVMGAKTAADIYGMETGLAAASNAPDENEIKRQQELDQRYRAKLEQLNNAAEEAAMGANANIAKKQARVSNKADVEAIRNEDFNPEQRAALIAASDKAVMAQRKQIYEQGMQDLVAIDDEITARLTAGNLKNELKTQYEDIMKWQAATTRKLYDVYSGTLSEDELQRRVNDIAKATERASEQALTQGNTPMEIIEKAEKRAAEGRKDAWTSTHKELVADTTKYNGVQIQAQWDLMENLDDISGKRTELEKKRQNEAYQAVLENYKNTEMAAEINAIKLIDIDQQGYEKRKSLFGDLYDAATTEGTDLEVSKLTAQFDALAKQFGVTTPLAKEFDRSLQDITDRNMEKSIANSTSFEEYFSKKFAFDEGMFDNATVATEKKFQRMYDIVADGATEMGGEVKNSFIDAFSGTLDSWESVWSSMKQTFLKTLASMIWEAKANPIRVSIVSLLTGTSAASAMSPAETLAGGFTVGSSDISSLIDSAKSGVSSPMWGSTGSQNGGLFSSLAKLPDKIDEFGKSVLKFGDSVKLSEGLMAAGLGYGIGTMFGGTSGGIGGAVGGMTGNMLGQGFASTVSAAFGETLGAMAPGIGQVIGTTAGTLIGAAFAGEKVTSKGIEITIGEGGILTAKNYTNYKSAGLFGGGNRTEYTQTDRSTVNYLSNKFEESTNSLIRAFENIGISASASGYTATADKIDLRQDPEEAIQAWLTKATRNLADYMVSDNNIISSFSALKEYGESSADAVIRLSDALTEFKEAAIDANVSIQNLSGGLRGLDLVSYTAQFTTMLGSAENVQDFFDIIKEFGTYAGGAGLSNIESLSTELKNAFSDIENVYATSGNNTVLSTLNYRKDALTGNVDDMYNRINEYSNRSTIWGKFIDIDEAGKVIINSVTNAITGAVTDIDTWASGSTKRQKEWDTLKSIIEEYTAGVSELANITERISQEQTNPSVNAPAISPTSTTFWTDMDAAMANLTPELAAAWYDAAKLARQIKEIRDAAKDAAESQRELQNEYMQQNLTTAKASKYLGVAYEGILNIAKASQQLNQNDIAGWFSDVTESTGLSGNMLVYNLVPALEKFQYEGETAIDTFNRLGQLLMELTDSAGVTGISLSEISGGLKGVDLAGFSQELVDLFGSSGAVSDAFSRFNQYANTETEQKTYAVDYWKNQAQSRIGELADAFPGVDTSNFWDKYKESMKKGLSPAELYQWDYAAQAMANMSEAAGTAADAIDELAKYLQSIQDKINEFGMTDTQKFLKSLEADKQEMKDNILSKGGTEADLAIVDQYGVAAIQDRIDSIMEGISSSMDALTGSDYDRKMAEIVKTTQENIQSLTDLGASEEQLTAVRAYETAQIEELKKAHTDYIQSIQDKINAFGQDDTDSFLNGIYADAEEMRKQLINTGGAGVDTSIADTYISAAIADRIKDTTDTLKESILDLGMDTFSKQIYDLNTSVAEGIKALEKLGASEEDIALIRQEAALRAKEIIKSAAQAYIQAYDDQLSKIEELESERQALQDAVDSARSDYISALQKEIDTKNEAITKLQENVDSLKEFISSLDELKNSLLEDAGFLSSTEKAGLAMANFEKIAAKAATGDTEARSQLSSAATSAASAAAQGYSYDQYIQTFAKIYGKVNELQDDAKKQLTPAEQELEAAIASRDALQAILDKLNEEADKTLSIADAEKAYQEAQSALAQSTLDAQIATLQAEADQHKELVEQLRKQYDETVSLSQAAKQYFNTVTALSSFTPETLSADKLIEQNVAMNNILSQTQDITSKAKKTADRTYDKVDEVLYFMQEDNKKLYKLLGDTYKGSYTYTETVDSVETNKTDVGLKVILSNMQVKDSILSALREANDLTTAPATSIVGLLNGIKDCACECQCNGTTTSCTYYGEAEESCAIMEKERSVIPDTSELAGGTFDKIFSTIDGALTAALTSALFTGENITFTGTTSAESPECANAFYLIVDVAVGG